MSGVYASLPPKCITGSRDVYPLSGAIDPAFVLHPRQLYRSSLPFRSVHAMVARYIVPTLQPNVEDLLAAAAGADLIIAPSEQFATSIVSDLTGIPWATVNLSPVSIPSRYVKPHPWPAPLPAMLQHVANRVQWGTAAAALRFMADGPVNAVRAPYGLPPKPNQLTTGNLSNSFAAIAASPAFLPAQPDWPPHLRVTGFCFWD